MLRSFIVGASLLGLLASARATAQETSGRDIVAAYNTGFQWGLSPGIAIPTEGGSAAFTLGLHAGYGIDFGPLIIMPGGDVAGYFFDSTVLTILATGKFIVPIGAFAPFVIGGIGPGFIFDPSDKGTAWKAGGGFTYYFGRSFGLGAQATYEAITGTGFRVFSVGPIIALSF